MNVVLDNSTKQTIETILANGNSAEVKVLRDKVVVWEVSSKKRDETPITSR